MASAGKAAFGSDTSAPEFFPIFSIRVICHFSLRSWRVGTAGSSIASHLADVIVESGLVGAVRRILPFKRLGVDKDRAIAEPCKMNSMLKTTVGEQVLI